MLTYVPASERPVSPSVQNEKPWLLLLLCAFWLLPGLLGHDPWKPYENSSIEIIRQISVGSGHWALPSMAGLVQLDVAPLYYWCASLLAYATGWLGVSMHDAARLSSGIWVALALWGVGLAASELHGRSYGRVAVVALIGSIGLLQWGHHISPAVVALAAFAWQLYALALARRRPLPAGALLGLSWLVLLLGATWGEALLAMACALSMLLFAERRTAAYAAALVSAWVIAVPLGLLWPLSLYRKAPDLFDIWLGSQSLGLYGGITHLQLFHKLGYLPSIVAWFAFPVLPLALWAFWSFRRQLSESRWQLLILQTIMVTLWLLFAGRLSAAQALLLLVPLAVSAAGGVDELRRGAASSLFWFGSFTFGALALALWGSWLALQFGWPDSWIAFVRKYGHMSSPAMGVGVLFALGISAAWVHMLLRNRPFGRRAVTAWACGLTLSWGLLVSLWFPWLDLAKSYREVGVEVAKVVNSAPDCVAARFGGDEQRGGIAYFSQLDLRSSVPTSQACNWVLTQHSAQLQSWTLRWEGGRPGEKNERFYLYQRQSVQ